MNDDSIFDDFEPNVHPTIAYALHGMRWSHAVGLANERLKNPDAWPFPAQPIPPDSKPAPRHPDAEDAPI